jgi:hypothetical protein
LPDWQGPEFDPSLFIIFLQFRSPSLRLVNAFFSFVSPIAKERYLLPEVPKLMRNSDSQNAPERQLTRLATAIPIFIQELRQFFGPSARS